MAKPWARIEIGYLDHPKFQALNGNAISLWHEGKQYCDRFHTDGLIPAATAKRFRFGGTRSIEMLTTAIDLPKGDGTAYAPLWEAHPVGFKMHDYLEYNDCREAVLARMEQAEESRAVDRERLKRWRAAKRGETPFQKRRGNAAETLLTETQTSTSSKEPPSEVSAEPPILVFPTVGPVKSWGLTQAKLDEWQALFPNLDALAVMRKAVAWCQENPAKRKTAKGMPRCLVGWLSRETDRPSRSVTPVVMQRSAAPMPTYAEWECPHVEEHSSKFFCDQATALGRPRKSDAAKVTA